MGMPVSSSSLSNSVGDLILGVHTLSEDNYRLDLAKGLFIVADSPNNQGGFRASSDDIYSLATNIANYEGSFFSSDPKPLDIEGPVISPQLVSGANIAGIMELDLYS